MLSRTTRKEFYAMYPHLYQDLKVASQKHQYTIKDEDTDGFCATEDELGNQLTTKIIPTDKYSAPIKFHKEVSLLK